MILGAFLCASVSAASASAPAGADVRRQHLDQARALASQGRHRAALRELDRALQIDANDRELRIERAKVNAWRGRHRASALALQGVLRDHPGDRDATHRLAEVWQWMDRPDPAEALLVQHLAHDPHDLHAAGVLRDLQRARRPEVAVDLRRFHQSDALLIEDLRTRVGFGAGAGGTGLASGLRWGLHAGVARFRPSQPVPAGITVRRLGLQATRPLGEVFSAWGTAGLEQIRGDALARPLQRWTHDLRLTFQPTDPWRLTLGSARRTFDSIEALRTGLTVRETRLALELRPDDVHRGAVEGASADYSDGNVRRSVRLSLQRRLNRWPHVAIGLRHHDDDYRRPGQAGYFNPDRLRSTHVAVDLGGDFGDRAGDLQWQVAGSMGVEREPGQEARAVRSGRVQLSGALAGDLHLELAYDHSTSRVVDRGGFARGILRFSLRQRF